MDRMLVIAGSLVMFIGVGAGAFGAHALRGFFLENPDLESTFETAVRYQLIQGLGLFAAAWVVNRWPVNTAVAAGWLFLAGIILFSGSLYILVLTGQKWLGAVTPIGGICFLAGWLLLAFTVWKN